MFIHNGNAFNCLTSLVSACPPPETVSSSQSLPCKSSRLRMLQENSPPCWAPFCNATSFLAGCHRSLKRTKDSIVKVYLTCKNSPVNERRWGRHKLYSDYCALVRKRSDTLGRGSVPQLHFTLTFEWFSFAQTLKTKWGFTFCSRGQCTSIHWERKHSDRSWMTF